MEAWLEWAREPAFICAFAFMILGIIRHVVLTMWGVWRVMRRAGDKKISYTQILITTLKWLFPFTKMKNRLAYSLTSVVFHVAIIIVPIFLGGHIALWARGLGVSWPAISNSVADILTIIALITAVALVIQRASARATRAISRLQDYVIPLVVALPYASGYLLMHPNLNPFKYEVALFIHVMSANLVFVLIPITKLSHMALVPSVQLVSEVAWHWPSHSGSKVGVALEKEGEPI